MKLQFDHTVTVAFFEDQDDEGLPCYYRRCESGNWAILSEGSWRSCPGDEHELEAEYKRLLQSGLDAKEAITCKEQQPNFNLAGALTLGEMVEVWRGLKEDRMTFLVSRFNTAELQKALESSKTALTAEESFTSSEHP